MQISPEIKNTPLKLNEEKTGLNIMGGKNWPTKEKWLKWISSRPHAGIC